MKLSSRNPKIKIVAKPCLERAREDIVYFAHHYVTINGEKLILNESQQNALRAIQHGKITATKGPRQSGKSLLCAIALAWNAIFKTEKIWYITLKMNSANDMSRRVSEIIINAGFGHLINRHTRDYIETISSKIFFTSCVSAPKSGRGHSISMVFLDEFSFFKNMDEIKELIGFLNGVMEAKIHALSTPSITIGAFQELYQALEKVEALEYSAVSLNRFSDKYLESMKAFLTEAQFKSEMLGEFA